MAKTLLEVFSGQMRCQRCNKLLAEFAPVGTIIKCARCKLVNKA